MEGEQRESRRVVTDAIKAKDQITAITDSLTSILMAPMDSRSLRTNKLEESRFVAAKYDLFFLSFSSKLLLEG